MIRYVGTSYVVAGEEVPAADTICECGHWHDEHDADEHDAGACGAPACECSAFRFSERESMPDAIADRGGDPAKWPAHVKRAAEAAIRAAEDGPRTLRHGSAEAITIETDERGFELHILSDDGDTYVWNVQAVAESLLDQCRELIEPWLAEGGRRR